MILDILGEIGEGCSIGIGLIVFFAILVRLFTRKKLNFKILIPFLGAFFGGCIGVFLGEFISETWAIIGGILFIPLGIFVSLNLSSQA